MGFSGQCKPCVIFQQKFLPSLSKMFHNSKFLDAYFSCFQSPIQSIGFVSGNRYEMANDTEMILHCKISVFFGIPC